MELPISRKLDEDVATIFSFPFERKVPYREAFLHKNNISWKRDGEEEEGSIVSEIFSNGLDSEGVKLNFVCLVETRRFYSGVL